MTKKETSKEVIKRDLELLEKNLNESLASEIHLALRSLTTLLVQEENALDL